MGTIFNKSPLFVSNYQRFSGAAPHEPFTELSQQITNCPLRAVLLACASTSFTFVWRAEMIAQ